MIIQEIVNTPKILNINIWKMYFDGEISKDGLGAGIVHISRDNV